jgi:hypothetical protein
MTDKTHLGEEATTDTTGNLYHASADRGSVSGGWGSLPPPSPVNWIAAGLAFAVPAVGAWWVSHRRHTRR